MKVCPFCKEEIRDEAIKCRYCQSSLLPPQPAREIAQPATEAPPSTQAGDKGKTVLILDNGLIFFGKFVAGALVIFATIGLFLYGFDLKEMHNEAESAAEGAKSSAVETAKVEVAVQKAQDEVKTDQVSAKAAADDAKAKTAALQQQLQDVQAKYAETSDAATKALAAQKDMASEQKAFEQSRQDAQKLLDDAKSVSEEILSDKQTVDVAVAHILSVNQTPPGPAGGAGSTAPTSPTPSQSSSPTPSEPEKDRSFTPVELAHLYNLPSNLEGRGQTIGLIELGGGYEQNNLAAYFKEIKKPMPKITWVAVDGGKNLPTNAQSADGQVQGDIEIAGAVAPSSQIIIYFCPNTDKGFIDGILAAIHDDAHHVSVLSISWGGAESSWTVQTAMAMNDALKEAVARGITVLAASGDNGPTDGTSQLAVDFPASSPWVTAVGGTHLLATGGVIESETPWDDSKMNDGSSGWGVSTIFALPPWQAQAGAPKTAAGFAGRAIPDVVADASPKTGYTVRVDGQTFPIGGTAVAAPLWAGFIALLNQGLGHNIGFLNEKLYTKLGPKMALRRVGTADAAESSAQGSGWSPITGWGAPDGEKLLAALQQP